jgi:hypothetical protein
MKGKIDKNGYFYIQRAGKYAKQDCPFASRGSSGVECGGWCALFGEPSEATASGRVELELCRDKPLRFDEFTDEREVS